MCVYIYIFIYTYYIYIYISSNATCLIRPRSHYASFVASRITIINNMLHDSPLLKKAGVRQVVLDEWFPLNEYKNTRSSEL